MPGDAASAVPALRQALAAGAEERALARLARDPQITRRLEQFTRALEKAPDLKAALRDPRVLGVVLPALGLADGVSQPGLALRALTADPKDKEGLLARLPDRRWKSAAEALNLAERGIAALRDPKVQARLAEGLRRVTWQGELDAGQPGLSDAMLFRERAASAKTAYDVLGDPVLRRVVTGALGLPQQMAVQPVETQARAIASRVDIAKLQNPREVAKLAERYVVATAGSGSAAPASWLAGLFA
jgi:hypothetical protein